MARITLQNRETRGKPQLQNTPALAEAFSRLAKIIGGDVRLMEVSRSVLDIADDNNRIRLDVEERNGSSVGFAEFGGKDMRVLSYGGDSMSLAKAEAVCELVTRIGGSLALPDGWGSVKADLSLDLS